MTEHAKDAQQRLDRLERENRRLKQTGGLALVGLATLLLMGQAAPPAVSPAVETQRLVLRDATGRARIELAVLPDGSPTLGFLDQGGTPRAVLGLSPQGAPGLAFLDEAERPRLTLGLRPKGASAVSLVAPDGQVRASLELDIDGVPGLMFFDRKGRAQAVLGVMADGQLFEFPGGR